MIGAIENGGQATHSGVGDPVEGDAVMSRSTFFVQECPTCGRRVQIRVEYLGRQVVCDHCRGHFEAFDGSMGPHDNGEAPSAILLRANQLLETALERRPWAR
jgi:hypothetical protein